MCGQAYLTSARIAEAMGPFPGYAKNDEPFLDVIKMHRDAVNRINQPRDPQRYVSGREELLERCVRVGQAGRL